MILSQGENSFGSQVCTRICCYGDHLLTPDVLSKREVSTASEKGEKVTRLLMLLLLGEGTECLV